MLLLLYKFLKIWLKMTSHRGIFLIIEELMLFYFLGLTTEQYYYTVEYEVSVTTLTMLLVI